MRTVRSASGRGRRRQGTNLGGLKKERRKERRTEGNNEVKEGRKEVIGQ